MRFLITFFCAAALSCAAQDASLARLEQQLERLTHTTDAVTGVSVTHIESGRSVSVRGAEAFPMASAFKLPVAIQIMSLIDEGRLSMEKMVPLGPVDLHPGSGKLTELFFHPGVSLSVGNLMELMMVISDNTAADVMLREAGGPAVVTGKMRALGLPGIRVDRSTALLISAWQGAANIPPEKEWNREMWDRLYDAVPEREHMAARRAETKDPRDTATPDDMTRLLVRLWKKDVVSSQSTAALLEIMERCQTGKSRLHGMLPLNAPVAHKTGTLGGVANDIGIITLPGDSGHLAISVFTKGSARPEEVSEKAIAEIARTVYDYFVLVH